MPKYFLLTAGDQHYPSSGDGDWKGFYETYDDANAEVEKVYVFPARWVGNKLVVDENAPKIFNSNYKILGNTYDWYEIIDLTNRIN